MARLALLSAAAAIAAFLVGVTAGFAYTSHYGDVLVEVEPVPDYTRSIVVNAERVRVELGAEPAPGVGRAECMVNVTLFNGKGGLLGSHLLKVGEGFEADAGEWPVVLVVRVIDCEGAINSWLRVTASS